MATGQSTDTDVFRRLLLAIVVLGLVGTGADLLLLAHYEDPWQFVPLVLTAAALGAVGVHLATGGAGSVRALRVLMGACIVAGAVGVVLHYRGNLEFQLEMDATQSHWQLFTKVLRAKTPPAVEPGVMTQLGLLGLLYTYRHPALGRRRVADLSTSHSRSVT